METETLPPRVDLQPIERLLEAEEDDLIAVYLFGSQARGDVRSDSDVDLGLLFGDPVPRTGSDRHLDLETRLELTVGRPVQAVVLNRAPADLVHRVLRDGRLLLDRDRSRRIAFEVLRRNEYFDLQPLLELYRRAR